MNIYLKQFIECHDGIVNKLIHVVGVIIIIFGIYYKNIPIVLLGFLVPELGHTYQYWKTKNIKYAPWFCIKSQLRIVPPVIILIILYILLTK